jgi:hypothetical protein
LTHERCAAELAAMPFRDPERHEKFLSGNASALFFPAS